jgi:hypothetical protein
MSNTYGRTFLSQLSAHRAPHASWHRGDVRVLCKREENVVMPWRLLFWHNHVHKQASTEHVQPTRLDMLVPWYMYSYASHMCYVSRFLPGGHEERTAVPQTPPNTGVPKGISSPQSLHRPHKHRPCSCYRLHDSDGHEAGDTRFLMRHGSRQENKVG